MGLIGTLVAHALLLQCWVHAVGLRGANADFSHAFARKGTTPLMWIQAVGPATPANSVGADVAPRLLARQWTMRALEHELQPSRDLSAAFAGPDEELARRLLERVTLREQCLQQYRDPTELARDVATVSVHDRAIARGHIAGDDLRISSADRQVALMALQCLQLFGTFGAAVVVSE